MGLPLGLQELQASLLCCRGLEGHQHGDLNDVVVRLLQSHRRQCTFLPLLAHGVVGGVQARQPAPVIGVATPPPLPRCLLAVEEDLGLTTENAGARSG